MKQQLTILIFTLSAWVTASGQTWVVDSIYHQTQYRYYGAYLPVAYNGTTPWPVVLTLHGGGGNALGTVGFTQMNNVADTANFIVVYPQGTQVGTKCCSWAAGVGSPSDTLGIDDILFFNKLLDTLITQFNVDTNRIYSTGLSQGGYMSQRLACELSNRIAAVAPLCSNLDSLQMISCNPTRPISIMVINGTSDLLVPYNGATFRNNGWPLTYFPTDTLMNFWALKNGCNIIPISQNLPDTNLTDNSTITKFQYSNCNCNVQTILYRVNGGGHTWPGVENTFYELLAGETNEDVHASADIWNFFKQHSLTCLTTGIDELGLPQTITIFPNPTDNILNVRNNNSLKITLTLTDITGLTILTTEVMGDTLVSLDLTNFQTGIYLLTDGQRTTKIIRN